MIIDFHVHAFPDSIAETAIPVLASTADVTAYTDGTINGVKESMHNAGIDKSCILSIATRAGQTPRITDWCGIINREESIIPFGSIHPDYEDYAKEIKRMRELGIKGVKLHPDYQRFFVDDENMYGIYEELLKNDMIILFHAGVDIALPKPYHCTPRRLKNVLDKFRGGKFIAAHMGGFLYWNDVEEYLVGSECFLDTSYTLGYIDNSIFIDIIKKHGAEKIIFGTDSPWKDQKAEIDVLNKLNLSEEERELIYHKNAEKLLGI